MKHFDIIVSIVLVYIFDAGIKAVLTINLLLRLLCKTRLCFDANKKSGLRTLFFLPKFSPTVGFRRRAVCTWNKHLGSLSSRTASKQNIFSPFSVNFIFSLKNQFISAVKFFLLKQICARLGNFPTSSANRWVADPWRRDSYLFDNPFHHSGRLGSSESSESENQLKKSKPTIHSNNKISDKTTTKLSLVVKQWPRSTYERYLNKSSWIPFIPLDRKFVREGSSVAVMVWILFAFLF